MRTACSIGSAASALGAERSVMKSQSTIGFETLEAENLEELSFEQIIADHPDEFSDRAIWHAKKRLGCRPCLKVRPRLPSRPYKDEPRR
jgi:hypothetical protein